MADDGRRVNKVPVMEMVIVVVSVAKVFTIVSGKVCCRRDEATPGSFEG